MNSWEVRGRWQKTGNFVVSFVVSLVDKVRDNAYDKVGAFIHTCGNFRQTPSRYTFSVSDGRRRSISFFTIWSLLMPAASALKVVITRWRSTGSATAATSAVVAW